METTKAEKNKFKPQRDSTVYVTHTLGIGSEVVGDVGLQVCSQRRSTQKTVVHWLLLHTQHGEEPRCTLVLVGLCLA